jgi:hypothetical protein
MSGMWSTYWYNGFVYGSEIARGVDVSHLIPTQFLTQNEIDAANQVHFDGINVQNQPRITWPPNLIVARAYLDQLARNNAIAPDRVAELNAAVDKVQTSPRDRRELARLQALGSRLEKDAAAAKTAACAEQMRAFAAIVRQRRPL